MKKLIILGLILGCFIWLGSKLGDTATPHLTSNSDAPAASPVPVYNLDHVTWRKGGFGAVAVVSGEIFNGGAGLGINPTLTCTTYAGNGTALNEMSKPIYATIPSHGSHRFSEISMGFIDQQSTRLGCKVE